MFLALGALALPLVGAPSRPDVVAFMDRLHGNHFGSDVRGRLLSGGELTYQTLEAILRDPRCDPARVPRVLILAGHVPENPNRYHRLALNRLVDDHEFVRGNSLNLLRQLGGPTDCVAIVPLLSDDGVTTCYAAVPSLADLGDRRVLQALDVWLAGPSWESFGQVHRDHVVRSREQLARSLKGIDAPPAPADEAVGRFTSPDADVRLAAVRRVARVGSAADLCPVAALLFDESIAVRRAAADTMAELGGEPALVALDVWLRGPTWNWIREDARPHVWAARQRLAQRLWEPRPTPVAPPPRPAGR